jgi:hypothetical protein
MSSHKDPVPHVAQSRRRTRRTASFAPLLALCAVAGGCATPSAIAPPRGDAPISIVAVQLTAAGHYVDLRYRVTDPERAQAALGPKVRPRLINEANGAAMAVPTTAKLGSLRQTQAVQEAGRTYFVMFINSGGVREGSRVTAELGELRFENLRVE